MIRVYRVGMWWGETEEWECGGEVEIRVYRVGMWWGEVEDPGVQSGNVGG